MKQHGIFSFMLFVLLVGAVFFLEKMGLEAGREISEIVVMLEEAEHLNFRRQEMEMNFDYIVGRTIQAETSAGIDGTKIQRRISKNLSGFFSEMETRSSGKTRPLVYVGGFGEKEISTEALMDNLKVLIVDSGKGIIVVQVFATGNEWKNEKIGAEISGKRARQEFIVPIGYMHSELVVGK